MKSVIAATMSLAFATSAIAAVSPTQVEKQPTAKTASQQLALGQSRSGQTTSSHGFSNGKTVR